jgi:hypothetical protein
MNSSRDADKKFLAAGTVQAMARDRRLRETRFTGNAPLCAADQGGISVYPMSCKRGLDWKRSSQAQMPGKEAPAV